MLLVGVCFFGGGRGVSDDSCIMERLGLNCHYAYLPFFIIAPSPATINPNPLSQDAPSRDLFPEPISLSVLLSYLSETNDGQMKCFKRNLSGDLFYLLSGILSL